MTVPQLRQIPYSSRARRSSAASICAASRLSRSSMATSSSSPSDSTALVASSGLRRGSPRSEEHTSELQSHSDLVCRLLLEKKKKTHIETSNDQSTTTTWQDSHRL